MMTGLEVFDRTVQKSFLWIDEIRHRLGTDRQRAYRLLRAVLHTLRDRLPPVEAAELGAQMPMLIRGLYFEGWTPTGKPVRVKRFDELVERVRGELGPATSHELAREALDAVFAVLDHHISAGELEHVRHCLPRALRAAWPETSGPAARGE